MASAVRFSGRTLAVEVDQSMQDMNWPATEVGHKVNKIGPISRKIKRDHN